MVFNSYLFGATMMKFNERKLYSMFKRAIPIPLRGRLDLSD
jgi:hypothetical protein